MILKTFEPLGVGVHQLNSTQNKPSMNLQLFADTSGTTSTDNSTTILTSTTNPMEGWIKGDIHCFVTNENNFLLVRLLSLLNNSKKVWDITYNTDGGVSTFKCLDGGNGTCTYDSNNLLTDIKILDENGSILDEVQLEYDPVTKFISTYKKIKYNCDGKTIISSLDPDYTSKSALDANTQIALNSGCYVFNTMNSMFQSCSALTTLDISKFNTSNVTNMSYMFEYCRSLTTLDVSNWDTSKVTDMNNMFYECKALTTLDASKWDTSKVTDMRNMFYYCNALTALDVSNWDTSNVTNMYCMFQYCSALTTLDVSNWDTSKVTNMHYMFQSCSALTTLDVSKWDTSKVTNMKNMFNDCESLTTLDVSKWDTSKVTDMDQMFSYCYVLTSLDLSNWDTSKVTNMNYMFEDCNSLTTITGVIDMKSCSSYNCSRMFDNCPNLTGVKIKNPPSGFTDTYASEISSGKIVIVQ